MEEDKPMAVTKPSLPTEAEYEAFRARMPRIKNTKRRDPERETLFDVLKRGGEIVSASAPQGTPDKALAEIANFSVSH
jgi:hypothetical protein